MNRRLEIKKLEQQLYMHCLCNEPQGSQLKLSSSCKERAAAAAAQFLLLPRPFVSQQTPSPPPYFFLSFLIWGSHLTASPAISPGEHFFLFIPTNHKSAF